MQKFGGPWTLIKLEILERYLDYYSTAMKNQSFKHCYIDAFAGSGSVYIKGVDESVPGSAIRALDYSFSRYIYVEKDLTYLNRLEQHIRNKCPNLIDSCQFIHGDCNELLGLINQYQWYRNRWRGVIFLDPYAMNLNWTALESIAATKAFDVWYLFPLSALQRNLRRDGRIAAANKKKISELLGTSQWEEAFYRTSPQGTLFGDVDLDKLPTDNIRDFIISRLKTIFPGVSENAKILRISGKNTPLFMLCFAVSNPSQNAIRLALTGADYILTHTD